MAYCNVLRIFILVLAFSFNLASADAQIQLSANCSMSGTHALADSIKFISIVHGSAFHYYEYPRNYTQKSLRFYWDEYSKKWDDYEDSVRWTSPDSSFVMLKYFDGFDYDYPLDSFGDIDYEKIDTARIREVIDERFEKAEKYAFPEHPDATTENICRNGNTLTLCSKSSDKRLLYKIIVADVEGGMHEFIVLSIEYPLSKSETYDAVAVDCMNYFSNE